MKSAHGAAGKQGWRAALAGAAALALGTAGLVAASPAQAATTTIKNATFKWSVNDESTGGSYFGGCNFLVAGKAGDAGSSHVWGTADADKLIAGKSTGALKDGNVSVHKSDGKAATFADKCKTAKGASVSTKVNASLADNHTGDYVQIDNGTGTVDPATDTGTIQWKGTWTFVYYGGMTYWSITDPKLEVKNGHGRFTGTYSGVGADMDDPSVWIGDLTKDKRYDKKKFVNGTIIDLKKAKVDLTSTGFSVTPDYLGVASTVGGRNEQADRTKTNQAWWGSMPDTWVAFNTLTNQDSYWYTSDGGAKSIQPRKKTNPITVKYSAQATASASHTVTGASKDKGLGLSVSGKNYTDAKDGVYTGIVEKSAKYPIEAKNVISAQYVTAAQIKSGAWKKEFSTAANKLSKDKAYDVIVWKAHGNATAATTSYRKALTLTDAQKKALWPAAPTPKPTATTTAAPTPKPTSTTTSAPSSPAVSPKLVDDSVKAGESLVVTGLGALEGKTLGAELHSAVVKTSAKVKDGRATVKVPAGFPAGKHSLVLTDGSAKVASLPFTVQAQAAKPAMKVSPAKVSAKDFVNKKKGVAVAVSGVKAGKSVTVAIDGGKSVRGTKLTEKADAKGVARFAVYGTNASKPSAYLGTYSVKSSDPKVSGAFEVVSKVSSGDDGKPGSNDDGDSGSDNGNGSGNGNGGSDNGSGGSDNGSGSDGGNGGSRLPRTGAELGALGLGAGLLAIGGTALAVSRRRRA